MKTVMDGKLTDEQIAELRPSSGWAGVKFVILPAAMYVPTDKASGKTGINPHTGTIGEPYCMFEPPGLRGATAGDVFSLSEAEAAVLRPEQWLKQGLVAVVPDRKREPKRDATPDVPVPEPIPGPVEEVPDGS